MGMIHAPISHIRVVLEEKSAKEFYKMMITGNSPASIGNIFRKMLYQSDADFEKVKDLSYLTTAAGRQYRRTQFKRLVQLIQKEYNREGIVMRRDKIVRNVLEKSAEEFVQSRKRQAEQRLLTNRTGRLAHFEGNYKKK